MAPKIVDKTVRRQEIMEAAIAVFGRRRIAATKIEHITKEAGIGKGTFYEYFENKNDLIYAIIDSFMNDFDGGFKTILKSDIQPSQKIATLFTSSCETAAVTGAIQDIFYEFWRLAFIEKEERATAWMKRLYRGYTKVFETLLKAGQEAGEFGAMETLETARLLVGAIDALQLQFMVNGETIDMKKSATNAVTVILNGIKKGN